MITMSMGHMTSLPRLRDPLGFDNEASQLHSLQIHTALAQLRRGNSHTVI